MVTAMWSVSNRTGTSNSKSAVTSTPSAGGVLKVTSPVVRRVRDETDRRRVLVELTDEARRRAWEVWGPIAEEAGRMFAAYDEEQLRFILDFMGGAVEFLERHRARVRELGAA